jgi:hypothetical protein
VLGWGFPTCQDGDVALIKERLTLDHPNAIRQCRSWTERSSQIRYCGDGRSVRLQTTASMRIRRLNSPRCPVRMRYPRVVTLLPRRVNH